MGTPSGLRRRLDGATRCGARSSPGTHDREAGRATSARRPGPIPGDYRGRLAGPVGKLGERNPESQGFGWPALARPAALSHGQRPSRNAAVRAESWLPSGGVGFEPTAPTGPRSGPSASPEQPQPNRTPNANARLAGPARDSRCSHARHWPLSPRCSFSRNASVSGSTGASRIAREARARSRRRSLALRTAMKLGLPGWHAPRVIRGASSRRPNAHVAPGLDLSRRRVDVCLLSDRGELVAETAAPADVDGLRGLVERVAGGAGGCGR